MSFFYFENFCAYNFFKTTLALKLNLRLNKFKFKLIKQQCFAIHLQVSLKFILLKFDNYRCLKQLLYFLIYFIVFEIKGTLDCCGATRITLILSCRAI